MLQRKKRENSLFFNIYFSLSVFFMEFVFKLSTVGNMTFMSFVYMLMFSVAYGSIGYLLCTILKNTKINQYIAGILLGGTSVAYVVQFLIYKQFKQFYDINTMTNGAGDALTDYFMELLVLIFPSGGIFIMLLLFLPFIFFMVFRKGWLLPRKAVGRTRLLTVIYSASIYIFAVLFALWNPVSGPVYHDQYNFQSAVSDFGLITGLRLDVQSHIFGQELEFENPVVPTIHLENPDDVDATGDAAETTEKPIEYGYNVMDLDFDALDQKASSEQKKLNAYVKSLTPSKQNKYTGLFKGKNLIMISAEAFSAEVIDPVRTPTLYRMATKGIQFTDYYQPASAGTTGGEYQNIFGMLPTSGGKSFKMTAENYNYFTMGSQLNRLGYYGKAFHNNSYTYYSRNETHVNLGYSDGYMGYGNGMEQYVKKAWPQSDLEMFSGTLPTYIDKENFNVYYMTVSGHSNYTKSGNSQTKKHWDRVADLPYSDKIKGYLAANMDFEDAMTYVIKTLEAKGIADDTVIVISTDHFPYGLDNDAKLGNMPYLSELYGYDVKDYFQRDHSRLIIWSGCLEKMDPIVVDTPTFGCDILPTLSNLFGTEFDSRLMVGRDVFSDAMPLVWNANYEWKTEVGTYSRGKFTPASEDIVVPEGYVSSVKAIVKNKMTYSSGVLKTDYYRLLFKK